MGYIGRIIASLPFFILTLEFTYYHHHLNRTYIIMNLCIGIFSIGLAWFFGKQYDVAKKLLKRLSEKNIILEENKLELRRQQEQLELVFNNIQASIWYLDLSSNNLVLSKGAESLYGYSNEEFMQNPLLWKMVIHPNDKKRMELLEKRLLKGNKIHCEYRILRKYGDIRWVKDIVKPMVDATGYVTNLIGITIDITEQKQSEEKMKHMAYYDALTGLPNRNYLYEHLKRKLEDSNLSPISFAVLFLDIDGFKKVNDSMGHFVGDLFLQEVAKRLKACIRKEDTFVRHGGDEFILLLKTTNKSEIQNVACTIQQAVSQPIVLQNEVLYTTLSIGISLYPDDGEDFRQLLRKADSAMYYAKEQGKNNFQFYNSEIDTVSKRKQALEHGLKTAIERNELSLHYQPQVELKTGEVIGFEALLRWNHPTLGNISPLEFIPVAEETGSIIPVGKWVIETACKQLKAWHDHGMFLKVAVNVSPIQFKDKQFVETVKQILFINQLSPEYLELEITETVMQNIYESLIILNELKEIGVKISMDDFGTGYSSLNVLGSLPIDYVKIDRSFVKEIENNTTIASIVKTIIQMGTTLHFELIAEGVETKEQAAFLSKHGCHFGQGYYFSFPLSAESVETFIQNKKLA